jgi:hypothetical protein
VVGISIIAASTSWTMPAIASRGVSAFDESDGNSRHSPIQTRSGSRQKMVKVYSGIERLNPCRKRHNPRSYHSVTPGPLKRC